MKRLERLIHLLSRLPGFGKKSASRIVYWLLETDEEYLKTLSGELGELRNHILRCRICGNYSEADVCEICVSPFRDRSVLCVVEQARDAATIENTGDFRGLYHVLHGVLSPLDGMGPEELGLNKLKTRIRSEGIAEVIIATNLTLEGDSTALYLVRLLRDDHVKITRIASGLPVGGDLEYADKLSISRALSARQGMND